MLVSKNVSCSLIVKFDFTFDDPLLNHSLECKVGDKVLAKFIVSQETIEIIGIITNIEINAVIEKNVNPIIKIDASEEFNSKVYSIQASNILDINIII